MLEYWYIYTVVYWTVMSLYTLNTLRAQCKRVTKVSQFSSRNHLHFTSTAVSYVRAHCYCASLLRTTFIRHAHVTSSISHRVETQQNIELIDDLCVNLMCEYFCWMLGDHALFFGRSLPFLILSIILKNKKKLYVGSFNYFSYTFQIGSNWYMEYLYLLKTWSLDNAIREFSLA